MLDSGAESSPLTNSTQDNGYCISRNTEQLIHQNVNWDGNAQANMARTHGLTADQNDISYEQFTYKSDLSVASLSLRGSSSSMSTFIIQSPHLELSLPVFKDQDSGMLMHDYMNHIADMLQPIFHPANPWHTTYVPIALKGSSQVMVARNYSGSSYAAVALSHQLHSIFND